LSAPAGKLAVTWSVVPLSDQRVLKLIWKEKDGGAARRPDAGGFEPGLLEGAIPGTQVKHERLADGLSCTIELGLQKAPAAGTGGAG
jgi:hypothetical protein